MVERKKRGEAVRFLEGVGRKKLNGYNLLQEEGKEKNHRLIHVTEGM